jgi:hypothetical protein
MRRSITGLVPPSRSSRRKSKCGSPNFVGVSLVSAFGPLVLVFTHSEYYSVSKDILGSLSTAF